MAARSDLERLVAALWERDRGEEALAKVLGLDTATVKRLAAVALERELAKRASFNRLTIGPAAMRERMRRAAW